MASTANAADTLSTEAQKNLEPTHQNSQGFEADQRLRTERSPAARRAIAKRIQSMTPEERQAGREKFESMSEEERESARAEILNRVQSKVEEQRQQRNQLQTL